MVLQINLRGLLSHIQHLRVGYWGISSVKVHSSSPYGLASPSPDAVDESQQPTEASGVGRSWVQSMFSRDTSTRNNSFSRGVRRWTSDNSNPGIFLNVYRSLCSRLSSETWIPSDKSLLHYFWFQLQMRTSKVQLLPVGQNYQMPGRRKSSQVCVFSEATLVPSLLYIV